MLRSRLALALALAVAPAVAPNLVAAQAPEAIWYIRNNEAGIASFIANARHISIIAPQTYAIDSTGNVTGRMDPRIVATARANGVQLMPLVMNPGFDVAILHRIVTDPVARTNSARNMAALCRREKVHGIQLDLENLHVSDRDAFTAFAREFADSVRAAGCHASAAVVPRTNDERGTRPYHHMMYDYWRGAYDYKALADALDFLSYMTYAQHTGGSTPGPVAGFPWMTASLQYVLDAGVPPEKISLGLAGYSDYWYAGYNPTTGVSRTVGEDIGYVRLMEIIRRAAATPVWDATQKAWVAMWESHGVFEHAWIEDARAFEEKMTLVPRHRLRGYSVWLLGDEDPRTWEIVGPVKR
jgi:spore germination protein YaaH